MLVPAHPLGGQHAPPTRWAAASCSRGAPPAAACPPDSSIYSTMPAARQVGGGGWRQQQGQCAKGHGVGQGTVWPPPGAGWLAWAHGLGTWLHCMQRRNARASASLGAQAPAAAALHKPGTGSRDPAQACATHRRSTGRRAGRSGGLGPPPPLPPAPRLASQCPGSLLAQCSLRGRRRGSGVGWSAGGGVRLGLVAGGPMRSQPALDGQGAARSGNRARVATSARHAAGGLPAPPPHLACRRRSAWR